MKSTFNPKKEAHCSILTRLRIWLEGVKSKKESGALKMDVIIPPIGTEKSQWQWLRAKLPSPI